MHNKARRDLMDDLYDQRRMQQEDQSQKMKLLRYSLIFLLTLFTASSFEPISASGVFELELIDFQRLDQQQSAANNQIASSAPIRLVVCLKEAFTSQLDGPCTFGNASMTLGRHHTSLPTTTMKTTTNKSTSEFASASSEHEQSKAGVTLQPSMDQQAASAEAQRQRSQDQNDTSSKQHHAGDHVYQQQADSVMTNLVGIKFTFRWTKSFTIILSAEQIGQQTGQSTNNEDTRSSEPKMIINPAATNQTGTANQPTELSSHSSTSTNLILDRHVLTENEVLPSLETSLNRTPAWATRFQRSLKSSIVYKFRVYCALNYFGDGCTTFCRARDDQFGHYDCSSNGQKICHEGWHGTNCDKAKCRSGCNQQHGYCDKPDTCQCRPGWTGARCDECITYPGCQNGYCLSPWQCICHLNWGGVLCDQDLNYCGSHDPCLNNGTCQNVAPGRYKCLCAEGYTGVNCETNLSALTQLSAGCALNPCLNGGQCYGYNALSDTSQALQQKFSNNTAALKNDSPLIKSGENQVQNLPPTTSDDLLATVHMLEEIEQHGQPNLQYRCNCPHGWTGDYCQWAESLTLPIDLIINPTEDSHSVQQEPAPSITSAFVSVDNILTNHNESSLESLHQSITTTTESAFIESESLMTTELSQRHHHQLEMRRLISGVVVASAVGVFIAALMLAWCCLVAIEKNKFSFIQMNVIRQSSNSPVGACGNINSGGMTSTLRRMHEKIRDSFRCSQSQSCHIKPETKLSIENVLRPPKMPPPSYEESKYVSKLDLIVGESTKHQFGSVVASNRALNLECPMLENRLEESEKYAEEEKDLSPTDLIKTNSLERQQKSKDLVTNTNEVVVPIEAIRDAGITNAHLNCPRHGHLYRKQQQYSQPEREHSSTMIQIEYKPSTLRSTDYDHLRHKYHIFSQDLG